MECTIRRCSELARWIVTIAGHPNGPGISQHGYCREHAKGKVGALWEDSPTPYKVSARGPFEPLQLAREIGARHA